MQEEQGNKPALAVTAISKEESSPEEDKKAWKKSSNTSPKWTNEVPESGQNWLDDDPAPKGIVRSYSMVSYGELRGPAPIIFPADIKEKEAKEAEQNLARKQAKKVTWHLTDDVSPDAIQYKSKRGPQVLLARQKEEAKKREEAARLEIHGAQLLEALTANSKEEKSELQISNHTSPASLQTKNSVSEMPVKSQTNVGEGNPEKEQPQAESHKEIIAGKVQADSESKEPNLQDTVNVRLGSEKGEVVPDKEEKEVAKETVPLGKVVTSLLSPLWLQDKEDAFSGSDSDLDTSGPSTKTKKPSSISSLDGYGSQRNDSDFSDNEKLSKAENLKRSQKEDVLREEAPDSQKLQKPSQASNSKDGAPKNTVKISASGASMTFLKPTNRLVRQSKHDIKLETIDPSSSNSQSSDSPKDNFEPTGLKFKFKGVRNSIEIIKPEVKDIKLVSIQDIKPLQSSLDEDISTKQDLSQICNIEEDIRIKEGTVLPDLSILPDITESKKDIEDTSMIAEAGSQTSSEKSSEQISPSQDFLNEISNEVSQCFMQSSSPRLPW